MSLQNSHDISEIKVMLKKGADGDSITSIEKTGTSGLVDTYTITLNTGTKYTFTVANGKSIVSIEKTATVGLVDTYTITFNDGTTTTFDVTNGQDMSPDVSAVVNLYGSKNLNNYPYNQTTKTENGITFTDNGDGTITVGDANEPQTASGDAWFECHHRLPASNTKGAPCVIPNGDYILTGCPSGGSDGTFGVRIDVVGDTFNSQVIKGWDYGDGFEFSLNGDYYSADSVHVGVNIKILSGTVIATPITFKPMIRDARISDDTYVPYAMPNRELTPLYDVPFDLDNSNDTLANTDSFFTLSSGTVYTNVLSFTATKEMFGTLILTLNFIDNVNAGTRAIKIRIYRDSNNYSDVYEMQTPPISYTTDYQNFRYALPVHFKSGDSVYMQALQNSGSNVRVLGRIQFRGIQI